MEGENETYQSVSQQYAGVAGLGNKRSVVRDRQESGVDIGKHPNRIPVNNNTMIDFHGWFAVKLWKGIMRLNIHITGRNQSLRYEWNKFDQLNRFAFYQLLL